MANDTDIAGGVTNVTAIPDIIEVERIFLASSLHLAASGHADLAELELAIAGAHHSLERSIARAIAAAGMPDLSALDTLILQAINHRGHEKSFADLMKMLNLHDRHSLNYAIRKLDEHRLIVRRRQGKEVFLGMTDRGRTCCAEYARVRRARLLGLIPSDHAVAGVAIRDLAGALRTLGDLFDKSASAAGER